ncbi:MAG: twin-arginine translocation signal domain-containing protein [Armatimonadetes bacterium]|nr:twin-arginine translocation signal domain-containing protein [Armatimonadota bacterium]
MEDKLDRKGMSRRDFIRSAGATAAGVVAGSLIGKTASFGAPAAPRVIGANDRINIGIIGIGGMGGGHLGMLKDMQKDQNIKVVAVCDVWDSRLRRWNAASTSTSRSRCATNSRKRSPCGIRRSGRSAWCRSALRAAPTRSGIRRARS